MIALTTHQRDILRQLLESDGALAVAELGRQVRLSPRQVQYGLRAVEAWLSQHGAALQRTPGVGAQVACRPELKQALLHELSSQRAFQLVLAPDQRQQLLALHLLAATEPSTLHQFQDDLQSSRTTVLKDLDLLEPWLRSFGLSLDRRPNFGCVLAGPELAQRQALAALLWGDSFDNPISTLSATQGLSYFSTQDAVLVPLVRQGQQLVQACDPGATLPLVAEAEAELGARFTDEAAWLLALAFAISRQRVRAGRRVTSDSDLLAWLQARPIWPVAARIGTNLLGELGCAGPIEHECALIAMHLLSGARDGGASSELVRDAALAPLIDTLMRTIARAYDRPRLERQRDLRGGLEAHVLSVCLHLRFGLWAPRADPPHTGAEEYAIEWKVAHQLAEQIGAVIGQPFPQAEIAQLVLLLAAFARERSPRPKRILVVCPSGMATTQLLVTRLRTRFPRLGSFEVLSLRDLIPEHIAGADLIISTVPLRLPDPDLITVIQVHPLLRAEDVAAIMQWSA